MSSELPKGPTTASFGTPVLEQPRGSARAAVARTVTGLIAVGAVVAAVGFSGALPVHAPPGAGDTGATVSVAPERQPVACPGPLVTPGASGGGDSDLSGAPSDVSAQTFTTGSRVDVGDGESSDAIVAGHIERVGGGDISGLAGLTCSAPRADQWIVGGSTAVGDSARLVLTNPAASSVESTVTVFGPLGPIDDSTRVVPIAAESQATLLLEGVAAEADTLVIHITTTGTGVSAALQDSRLTGFQPAGTDWVIPGADPAESLVIPGVGTEGDGTTTVTLRLMSPEGATATLGLATSDGNAVWEGVASLELDAGVVVEVPVPAVDAGSVTIAADAPVVAGALVTRERPATVGVEGDVAHDIRWIAAEPGADSPDREAERAVVSVGYRERVAIYADADGTFDLSDERGDPVASVALQAGQSITVPIQVDAGRVLTASGPFAWTVLVDDGRLLTALQPTRTTIDDVTIRVVQRPYIPAP